jgi:UDP-glucose-4-epimerase GalE
LDAERVVVLVTGGAGYIGSHTCKALRRAGFQVVVFDNLSSGHRAAVRYGDLVVADIADVGAVRETIRRFGVTAVMHFAALLDVAESMREPARYYRNNVAGTLGVLGAMADESVRHFIFSSTCATFGEPIETPIVETHPQHPINAYGESKLAIERALPHFEGAYGIHSTILRYFNAAGADPDGELGEDHSPEIHVIPRTIAAALGGEGVSIFGDDYPTPDGTCLRDYVHVSDLAEAHVKALEALIETNRSGAYNLGTGQPHSVRQVIQAVERVSGRSLEAHVAPRRPGDPAVLYAAPHKANTELRWLPRFMDLESIVRTAWAWHHAHPGGYGAATPRG